MLPLCPFQGTVVESSSRGSTSLFHARQLLIPFSRALDALGDTSSPAVPQQKMSFANQMAHGVPSRFAQVRCSSSRFAQVRCSFYSTAGMQKATHNTKNYQEHMKS